MIKIKSLKYIMKMTSLIIGGLFLAVSLSPVQAHAADNNTAVVIENEKLIDTQSLIRELREKEKALNAREAELNARQAKLDTIEQDIIIREAEIKKMRKSVTDRLDELKTVEDVELDKLAKIYASTKPKSAAAIFVNMEMDRSIAVFRRMQPAAAAKILNEMGKLNPTYASKLSEGLTPQPVFENK